MTATKNVYALMLALVIVLSGCFGNTADDTDAQTPDESTDSTSGPEMISIGGTHIHRGSQGDGPDATYTVATINSTAGQIIQVHEADYTNGSTSLLAVKTECVGGEYFSNSPGNNYQIHPFYLPGSFTDCSHEITLSTWDTSDVTLSWSFVYSVSTVTVG